MGALTNKPMAFNSRTWEYNSQLINDLTDFLSPRIRVDQFNGKIYRVLPTVEWISNRIRFLYLGLRNQRLNQPTAVYAVKLRFRFLDRVVVFSKKILVVFSYDNAFRLLESKFLLKLKKNITVIFGNVFTADATVFKSFESCLTRVKFYSELNTNFVAEKLPNLEKNVILFGINPRMESPLFNLKIKELVNSEKQVYSVGNFDTTYPVTVISNSVSIFSLIKRGLLPDSLPVFGLSSLKFVDLFNNSNKVVLLPLYLFNNSIFNNFDKNKLLNKNIDDINIELDSQNLLAFDNVFSLKIATHFEDLGVGELKNGLILPISGYLESSMSFFDHETKLNKINSLKPNYGLSDLLTALKIIVSSGELKEKQGKIARLSMSLLKKTSNVFINNGVPNYLIRDPLGRSNQLFSEV